MFCKAPGKYDAKTEAASSSDQLKRPVLEAIKQFDGSVSGCSQADIVSQLRPRLPQASRRAICSALYKLVVEDHVLHYEASSLETRQGYEDETRTYSLFA